jgi:hypothetical protein
MPACSDVSNNSLEGDLPEAWLAGNSSRIMYL